jgi:hypothetical protein
VIDIGAETTIRLAGTEAVNCVELTYVVASGDAFQSTAAPDPNAVPFTVNVNAPPPAVTGEGLTDVIVGVIPDWVIVNVADDGCVKVIEVDRGGPELAATV